jgi:peptidylprolyl isomerase
MELKRWFAAFTMSLAGTGFAAPAWAQEILDKSPASDWRALDPGNTLYVELPAGRVVIELAPSYAPANVDAIRKLARDNTSTEAS